MKIVVNNVYSRFVLDNNKPVPAGLDVIKTGVLPQDLWENFSLKREDAYYIQKKLLAAGKPINVAKEATIKRFISRKTGKFGSGLLQDVILYLDSKKYEYEIVDLRNKLTPSVEVNDNILPNIILRDYQVNALKAVVEHQNCLIQSPTGSGKTTNLAALSVIFKNYRLLYIMDRVTLTRQTTKRFLEYGINKNEICTITKDTHSMKSSPYTWNEFSVPKARVVLCITHMANIVLKNEWEKFDGIILDESHHAKAPALSDQIEKTKNARLRVGYSGTVQSGDKIDDLMRKVYLGPVVYTLPTEELIERGILVKPIIRFLNVKRNDLEMWKSSNWHDVYRNGIVEFNLRNDYAMKLAKEIPGRTLVLFRNLEHGRQLMKRLGIIAESKLNSKKEVVYEPFPVYTKPKYKEKAIYYLDGSVDALTRDKVIAAMGKEHNAILIASTIFDEGVDLPGVESLIICTGEKSFIKQIQRLGRALRPNNQGLVFIFDFFDWSNDTLMEHSEERLRIWVREKHEVKRVKIKNS